MEKCVKITGPFWVAFMVYCVIRMSLVVDASTITCSFETPDLCKTWLQVSTDRLNWARIYRQQKGSPVEGQGPLNGYGGKGVYLNINGYMKRTFDTARLQSYPIEPGYITLSFQYMLYTPGMLNTASIRVYTLTYNGKDAPYLEDKVGRAIVSTQTTRRWVLETRKIRCERLCRIVIEGTIGTGKANDIAIDSVKLSGRQIKQTGSLTPQVTRSTSLSTITSTERITIKVTSPVTLSKHLPTTKPTARITTIETSPVTSFKKLPTINTTDFPAEESLYDTCDGKTCLRRDNVIDSLAKVTINRENVVKIVNETRNAIKHIGKLDTKDINTLASVLQKIAKVGNLSQETGKEFCGIYNVLIQSGDPYSTKLSTNTTNTTNTLVVAMDDFTRTLHLEKGQNFTYKNRNLLVHVVEFNPGEQPSWNGIEVLRGKKAKHGLSNELAYEMTSTTPHRFTDVDVGIYLPMTILKKLVNQTSNSLRISFVILTNTHVFPKSKTAKAEDDSAVMYLNTDIASATVSGDINKYIKQSAEPITIVFSPLNTTSDGNTRQCVFWDVDRNDWDSSGCYYKGITDGRVVCECVHLTNFAVLMSRSFVANRKALEIVTIVGLVLSIGGLSMTIITFIAFRQVRASQPQKLLFGLAVTLLCSYVVFLVGINRTATDVGCILVSALLHYLLLSSFLWMLSEAVLQYILFVKVFGSNIHNFTIKVSIVCYSVPLIAVAAVMAVDHRLYLGRKEEGYCWMDVYTSYWAFLLPIAFILLINFVVFVIVLFKISSRNPALNASKVDLKTSVCAGIGSSLLLGLAWTFGYLTLVDPTDIFAYVFTVLNSLHGLFIFLFFTHRNSKIRQYWRAMFSKITCPCVKRSGYADYKPRKGSSEPFLRSTMKDSRSETPGVVLSMSLSRDTETSSFITN